MNIIRNVCGVVAFYSIATNLLADFPPQYPVQRPVRLNPPPVESEFIVSPERLKQVIKGFGFEIQSDSIASGNAGLPAAITSVPHDLVPAERERFYQEMLKGFRYCRLAGGLYWRGLDLEQKNLQGRWPEQAAELREMVTESGIEGVSFECWSPAPYWKANREFTGANKSENVLRCYGTNFVNDPEYKGDVDRFLKDFAGACCRDLETLRSNGIPVSKWGLNNEPMVDTPYSSCVFNPENYCRTFLAVAPQIREFDPKIEIYADSAPDDQFRWNFKFIRSVLNDSENAKLVDALVVHQVGAEANVVLSIPPEKTGKPRYENEYEYVLGPTSPARCLNTVQYIMNWFQVGEAPTWFWLHALKPISNSEASGYSLGFWRPIADTNSMANPEFSGLKPGHWAWNKYNWYAVGSFVRHMSWDCRAVEVKEETPDNDLRIFAFKKPNGKLTVVLSNRSFVDHSFKIATGLNDARFKGWHYTPDDAGENFMGVEIGTLDGPTISPKVADLSWEFWEQE